MKKIGEFLIGPISTICNVITKILMFVNDLDEKIKRKLLILVCSIALLGPIIITITFFCNVGYKFLELIVWIVGQA